MPQPSHKNLSKIRCNRSLSRSMPRNGASTQGMLGAPERDPIGRRSIHRPAIDGRIIARCAMLVSSSIGDIRTSCLAAFYARRQACDPEQAHSRLYSRRYLKTDKRVKIAHRNPSRPIYPPIQHRSLLPWKPRSLPSLVYLSLTRVRQTADPHSRLIFG